MALAPDPRRVAWEAAQQGTFDVAIVGGGVSGAALFRELARRGFRVLLVDRGDFASGTSQASGMLAWGGLLYLRRLDIATVRKLSRARDALLSEQPGDFALARFRYVALREGARPVWLVRAALEAYWWLGGRRRARPRRELEFATHALLRAERFGASVAYDEARLVDSDARLVLGWILGVADEHAAAARVACNHCALVAGEREAAVGGARWRLEVEDSLSGARGVARARVLVNAGGAWADGLAATLGLATRHRHVLSKGVYLGFARPAPLDEFLAFEMGAHGDTLTYTPWGPIALFGPTETAVTSLADGFTARTEDVRFLLARANENLSARHGPDDVVSLRCGVRPLVVRHGSRRAKYPLDLSRRHALDVDSQRAALTLFGGKITSAPTLAREAADLIARATPATGAAAEDARGVALRPAAPPSKWVASAVPELAATAREERCATLLDCVRRRTNIAQWTARMGLGRGNEHRTTLRALAAAIEGEAGADQAVAELTALADAEARVIAAV